MHQYDEEPDLPQFAEGYNDEDDAEMNEEQEDGEIQEDGGNIPMYAEDEEDFEDD